MARDVILLGDVAERGARTIDIRCRRCDRHGRLSVARLLREYEPQTPLWVIWDALIGDCPKREDRTAGNQSVIVAHRGTPTTGRPAQQSSPAQSAMSPPA